MQALNVTIIVTRDSTIISNEHVRDSTDFADGNQALAYEIALNEWLAARPDPADIGSWRPRIVEVPVPTDFASDIAAELGRIIQPRDARLFPDTDPEAIAAASEHRPYDADAGTRAFTLPTGAAA